MLKTISNLQDALSQNISQFRLHLRRSRQQFSANCQLPTANCQLPTANCQLPTANCQLPTANCQLVANILFNQNLTGQSAPELC